MFISCDAFCEAVEHITDSCVREGVLYSRIQCFVTLDIVGLRADTN